MDKVARLNLIFQGVAALPAAATAQAAKAQLDQEINRVENLHSGVPYNPPSWATDGRIYPAQDDNRKKPTHPKAALEYVHKQHRSQFGANGAIRIIEIHTGNVVFQKAGADGQFL